MLFHVPGDDARVWLAHHTPLIAGVVGCSAVFTALSWWAVGVNLALSGVFVAAVCLGHRRCRWCPTFLSRGPRYVRRRRPVLLAYHLLGGRWWRWLVVWVLAVLFVIGSAVTLSVMTRDAWVIAGASAVVWWGAAALQYIGVEHAALGELWCPACAVAQR
jgi:hypothetical protein